MKTPLLFIAAICIQLSLFSQAWMQSPYLNKSAEEANYYEIVDAFNNWWGDRPYQKGSGYMPFKRWEYINSYRCYPDGKFPEPGSYWNAYQNVLTEYNTMKQDFEKTDVSNWTPLGLTAWQNGVNGYNPGNGRVNTVTVDPNNSQIVYIASPSGGIWKSVDGGQNWNTNYDQMQYLGVSAIAIHPDSSNVIFIGTGDRDAYDSKATGIYKSTDAGNTWTGKGFNSPSWNSINKIVFNPENPKTMFAASNNAVYRSQNGGNSWTVVYNQSRVTDLQYHPTDTSIIYGSGKYFIRSVNGGASFTRDLSVPNDTTRLEIAVTPANANYVYILATNNSSSYGGVYRSTNSGADFTLMSDSPNYLGYSMIADDDAGQGWFDLAIAASPVNANEIYIGGVNVWKSTNGGTSFNIISHWVYDDPTFYTHADIHYLGFYGNRLFCGSDGGVFFSDDYGSNWVDISEGLGITQVYRIASSPVDPNFIVCGTQDNGSNRLQSGNWTHIFGADGMQPMTHPTNNNVFYCSYQGGGLMRTDDNGYSIEFIQPDEASGAWVTPYAMHPTNHNTIYGGYEEVYKSTNAGYSWTTISNNLTGGYTLSRLKVSPVNPNYIFASRQGNLFVTRNGGTSWDTYTTGFTGTIVGIAPSYTDPEKLWIAITGSTGDRVFLTENSGLTFTNITGSLSGTGIRSLVNHKDFHEGIFVGTENAVFFKDTTMAAWIPYMNGLPNVYITDLEINYTNNRLRAGTYGRGIWETPIPTTASIQETVIYNKLNIYPNPSSGLFNVDFGDIDNVTTVLIFDVTGKLMLNIPVNEQVMKIDISQYVSGVYFLKAITPNKDYIQRIVLHN